MATIIAYIWLTSWNDYYYQRHASARNLTLPICVLPLNVVYKVSVYVDVIKVKKIFQHTIGLIFKLNIHSIVLLIKLNFYLQSRIYKYN